MRRVAIFLESLDLVAANLDQEVILVVIDFAVRMFAIRFRFDSNTIAFSGKDGYTANLAKGALTGTTDQGEKFKLKR